MHTRWPIVIGVLVFLTRASAQTDAPVYPDTEGSKHKDGILWLSGGIGFHSRNLQYPMEESGLCQELSIELPLWSAVRPCISYDRLQYYGAYHGYFGFGAAVVLINQRHWNLDVVPSLYIGGEVGISARLRPSYRVLDDGLRLETAVEYRSEGTPSPAGGTSRTFYTFSIGIGVALNKFLPTNPTH